MERIAAAGFGFTPGLAGVDAFETTSSAHRQGFAMRRTAILVVLVCLCCCADGSAQAPPYDGVIQQRVAEVRGGQSNIYPVTNRLAAGSRVRVLREESGWLAIAPPQGVPPNGSSSWVMERFLDQAPVAGRATICTVVGDDVPVMLGTFDQAAPLGHKTGTVKRGTMVVVLGDRATSDVTGDRTTWWRIQTTANEVRWLPKEALQSSATFAPVPAAPVMARSYGKSVPQLWTLAEQAEQSGNSSLAVVYYRQLASQQSLPGGDSNLATQATARADLLTRRTATTTSRPSYSAPTAAANNPNGSWANGVVYTSGPGVLRRVAFMIDNQPTFALEDARGYPRMYVVAQPGLSLETFVNRRVELFGPMVNRQELTIHGYMSVKTVHVLR